MSVLDPFQLIIGFDTEYVRVSEKDNRIVSYQFALFNPRTGKRASGLITPNGSRHHHRFSLGRLPRPGAGLRRRERLRRHRRRQIAAEGPHPDRCVLFQGGSAQLSRFPQAETPLHHPARHLCDDGASGHLRCAGHARPPPPRLGHPLRHPADRPGFGRQHQGARRTARLSQAVRSGRHRREGRHSRRHHAHGSGRHAAPRRLRAPTRSGTPRSPSSWLLRFARFADQWKLDKLPPTIASMGVAKLRSFAEQQLPLILGKKLNKRGRLSDDVPARGAGHPGDCRRRLSRWQERMLPTRTASCRFCRPAVPGSRSQGRLCHRDGTEPRHRLGGHRTRLPTSRGLPSSTP